MTVESPTQSTTGGVSHWDWWGPTDVSWLGVALALVSSGYNCGVLVVLKVLSAELSV
jgi:hypothetical protein